MHYRSDIISLATELAELSLLPELDKDIDAQQIEPEHFQNFKQILDRNLHRLFDLVQQHCEVLFDNQKETQIFRTNFVLLLCEQSAKNVSYTSDQPMLIQNVGNLLNKWFINIVSDACVFNLVLEKYKKTIKVDVWKRNLGALCGFHRFCQMYYMEGSKNIDMKEIFFVLATGTLLLEHYEPKYKEFGIDIYTVLLTRSNKIDIHSTNLHNAIYVTCLPNISKIQDEDISLKLWTCLYKCLELDDSWQNTSNWHRVDELMMDLLKRIAFDGNIRRSTVLFFYAAKLASLPYRNNSIINEFTNLSTTEKMLRLSQEDCSAATTVCWDPLRDECRRTNSYIVYKWIKKMLSLIGNHTMFYGDTFEVGLHLHAIHLTYIVWIFSIPVKLISSQILDLSTKLLPTLLECKLRYKQSPFVCAQICQLFTTFSKHFKNENVNFSMLSLKLKNRIETLDIIQNAIV